MALCSLSTGRTATPLRASGLHHDRARHHQDFLVRERDRLPGIDRGQHGVERRRARRGEEHDVGLGMGGDGDQALRATQGLRGAQRHDGEALRRRQTRHAVSTSRSCRARTARPVRPGARCSRRPPAPRRAGGPGVQRPPRGRSALSIRSSRESLCDARQESVRDDQKRKYRTNT